MAVSLLEDLNSIRTQNKFRKEWRTLSETKLIVDLKKIKDQGILMESQKIVTETYTQHIFRKG